MFKFHENKVEKILSKNPLCKSHNDLDRSKDAENGSVVYWLNPQKQHCFNFGWFTENDFKNWTNGTGRIIKGNTQEEKQKFWEIAQFEEKYLYGWAVGKYKEYYDLIEENYEPHFSYHKENKIPLKINSKNHDEIISKCFGSITKYYSDIYLETYDSFHSYKMESELNGVKSTLYLLGVGYYGAMNTPCEPNNLNWISDIAKYKSQYLYLQKQNVVMPDFDFVYNYRD